MRKELAYQHLAREFLEREALRVAVTLLKGG